MIYKIEKNIIKVLDKTQFNPKHILECGQIFRYGKDENNNYYVISLNKKATILEKDNCYERTFRGLKIGFYGTVRRAKKYSSWEKKYSSWEKRYSSSKSSQKSEK